MNAWDSLERVRQGTVDLVGQLTDEQLCGQHSELMSPIVWDLLHIAAFEQLWLQCNLVGAPGCIDALVDPDKHPRHSRGQLELPGPGEALQVLAQARELTAAHRGRAETPLAERLVRDDFVYNLVAQHEAQHQETMLAAVQLMADARLKRAKVPRSRPAVEDQVEIRAGSFKMGTDDRAQSYDNERPAHDVKLRAFAIDRYPVSNRRYLRFVEAGGYRDAQWWTDAGWAWVQAEQASGPLFWRSTASGWVERSFGEERALDLNKPVVHVCAHEADAFARWSGMRLPTEAEWERAAAWDPHAQRSRRYPWGDEPRRDAGNLDQLHPGTTALGSWPAGASVAGCEQLLSDVWEWTSSTFKPYPGFEAWPYPEYSEVFFGDHYRVLRGCSFGTRWEVARCTVRNWDYPQRRQIFAGFRCARSL